MIKENVSQHNYHDVFLICVLNEVVNFENKRCSDKLEEIEISHRSCCSDFSRVSALEVDRPNAKIHLASPPLADDKHRATKQES